MNFVCVTNCFTNVESGTCRQAKEIAVYILAAIATISLIGGMLGTLALHGVPLEGINAFAIVLGEKAVYGLLLAGTSGLLIDSALIAATIRGYHQLSLQHNRSRSVETPSPIHSDTQSENTQTHLELFCEAQKVIFTHTLSERLVHSHQYFAWDVELQGQMHYLLFMRLDCDQTHYLVLPKDICYQEFPNAHARETYIQLRPTLKAIQSLS